MFTEQARWANFVWLWRLRFSGGGGGVGEEGGAIFNDMLFFLPLRIFFACRRN